MRHWFACALTCLGCFTIALQAAGPTPPATDLRPSLQPTAIRHAATGFATIDGKADVTNGAIVLVRVTTSFGTSFVSPVAVRERGFSCRYPQDFPGAPILSPMLLYVDATTATEFGGPNLLQHQSEVLLVVSGGAAALPDLPLAFTDDFIDAQGRKDAASAQWPRQRALVNSFMHGRAAKLMGIHRPDFDLAKPGDFDWFKQRAALYDFDHRDRDWSHPLSNRVARGFWQAVWNTWFNASNDHPWDGNRDNRAQANFRPYTFANDAADLLVLQQMLRPATPHVPDNRHALVNEVLANLLAMQHRGTENFALREASGKQEHYTAGAFRYGMFETGEWLTEGKGWFANPQFRDFARGGVFNGRSVWALGESLKADPRGPHAARLREAIPLALRFCLHDALAHKYARRTRNGRIIWGGSAGEHGYLLLGMLSAAEVVPALPITLDPDQPARPLRTLCEESLDALAESARPDGTWSRYPNADAVNIAALAEGARSLKSRPGSKRWSAAAMRAADLWMSLRPNSAERTAPTPHFGYRNDRDASTSFRLGEDRHAHIPLYIGGHWIHALAVLHAITGEPRYATRAHALLAYYCGDNPLHTRLLTEIGSINNRVTDRDDDGIEETLHWDAYPESTAFVQIGLLHLLQSEPLR